MSDEPTTDSNAKEIETEKAVETWPCPCGPVCEAF